MGRNVLKNLKNLRLDSMYDEHFDIEYVDGVILKFLNRRYERNGEGGLFTVKRRDLDMRNIEIWYQMCWYLDSVL